MSSVYNLNALVEFGKDEAIDMVNTLTSSYFVSEPLLEKMYRMSLGRESAALDTHRTRELLISENMDALEGAREGDVTILGSMARATGRIAQLRNCHQALERVLSTISDHENHKATQLHLMMKCIQEVEKQAVRLYRSAKGFELQDLEISPDSQMLLAH